MRLSNNYILNFRHITIAVCFVFCALNSTQAQTPEPDYNKIWTTVGSAGTVDETDASKVFFDHSVVQMGHTLGENLPVANPAKTPDDAPIAQKPAIIPPQTESAVIRYNVTPVDGLFVPTPPCQAGTGCLSIQLELRYLAAGINAQVVAKLIEVDLATGAETVRLNFNSKAFAAADGYQVQAFGECGPLWRFDFKHKAYYIEATLTHSSIVGTSAAGIQMIKINNGICVG